MVELELKLERSMYPRYRSAMHVQAISEDDAVAQALDAAEDTLIRVVRVVKTPT